MSKELTPLQALNNIANIEMKEQYKIDKGGFAYRVVSDEYSKELKVIETALKENEKLKECYENELKNVSYYNNLALKYKKALEIIKEKILDMDYFNIIADRCDLTYQEYELLKEIFGK